MPARHDVVLFGPTGVTGREVARHLARRAPELGLNWAVAGRDPVRIEEALDGLDSAPAGIIVADSDDGASIDAMAASATVVANLVGPYARHGEDVYRACARHGTHQLDLNGEMDWLVRMMATYQDQAVESGARIVPTAMRSRHPHGRSPGNQFGPDAPPPRITDPGGGFGCGPGLGGRWWIRLWPVRPCGRGCLARPPWGPSRRPWP